MGIATNPQPLAQEKHQNQWATPLEQAAYYGDTNTVLKAIDSGYDVNTQNHDGFTLLSYAVAGNQLKIVKLLLEHGADPRIDKGSSMVNASYSEDSTMLKLLLDAGGDPNARFGFMLDTPILMAVRHDNIKSLVMLLERGADPNLADKFGYTPLIFVVTGNSTEMTSLLIEHGADIDATDINGFTALMYACQSGKINNVRFLLEKGADISIKDIYGLNAKAIAKKKGYINIVSLLEVRGHPCK